MFDIKLLKIAVVLPFAFACSTISVQDDTPPPVELVAALTAVVPDAEPSELKCTGGTGPGQTRTCTSDFVWVCPEGWSACTAEGAKTCCEKTFDVTDTGIDGLTTTG